MKKFLLSLSVLCLISSIAIAQEVEPKLYSFRIGEAVIENNNIIPIASLRFYRPISILNFVPIVRDFGVSIGRTLSAEKVPYWLLGGSFELNEICDIHGGWAFADEQNPKKYLGVSLDISVANKIIDLVQDILK
jgi:hypothetical protein